MFRESRNLEIRIFFYLAQSKLLSIPLDSSSSTSKNSTVEWGKAISFMLFPSVRVRTEKTNQACNFSLITSVGSQSLDPMQEKNEQMSISEKRYYYAMH